jgi:acyl-CoA thioesterase
MVNGLELCHGGLIFTLADSAMAFASNHPGTRAVSTHAEIDWLAPGRRGTVLTATCVTRHQRGKAAVHDVEVVDSDGVTVALFRGRTVQTAGPAPS